jgi:sulfatase maturation enzyme AslB (radical SAM superfamily)
MMTQKNADLIDSYDIVRRLGRGIKTTSQDEVAIGKKVDVWISGLFRIKLLQEPEILEKLKDKLILLNGSRIDVTDGWLDKTLQEYHYTPIFSDEEILQFYKKYGIINNSKKSFRFSAGMWTIFFMLEKVQTQKSLSIIGFDFFKSIAAIEVNENSVPPTSWHIPSVGSGEMVHNGPFEEKLVVEYIAKGQVNWIKLNDTNKVRTYKSVRYGTLAQRLSKKRERDKQILQDIAVINLNLTNNCNLRCTFCPIGSDTYVNDHAMMTIDTVKKFIERVREFHKQSGNRVTVSLSGKGEATVHKQFRDIVLLLAENKDVLRLQIITNGALLYKHKDLIPLFDRIRYNDYTADNNKNKESLIQVLQDFSKKQNISITPLDNTKEWHEIKDFTNRVGVLSGPVKEEIKYDYCHKLFNKMMIECDGSYLICCDDWEKHKNFGTIYEKSLKDHLLSGLMRKYRRHVLKGVRQLDPCRTCTYSSKPKKKHYA